MNISDLRGNIPTRIQKLRDGNYDAIVLAKAGVDRLQLDLSEFFVEVLNPTEFVPAPAQGVLGLQIREEDTRMAEIMQHLNNTDVAKRIGIERKVLNLLDGGCQLPLGVYCPNEKQVFVSHATSSNVAAKGYYYEPENLEEVVAQIVTELKNASVEA